MKSVSDLVGKPWWKGGFETQLQVCSSKPQTLPLCSVLTVPCRMQPPVRRSPILIAQKLGDYLPSNVQLVLVSGFATICMMAL